MSNKMEKWYALVGEATTFDEACTLSDEVCSNNDVLFIYSELGLLEHLDNAKIALGLQ